MHTVCLDASFIVARLTPHPHTDAANKLWDEWMSLNARMIAPPMLTPEVLSSLRKHVHFRRMTEDEGELAFRRFLAMPIEIVQPPDLSERAWNLARRFNRPNAYDAFYVALALTEDCDLWTGDRRMFNSFTLPNLRLLGGESAAR